MTDLSGIGTKIKEVAMNTAKGSGSKKRKRFGRSESGVDKAKRVVKNLLK